jgi:TonB family protein
MSNNFSLILTKKRIKMITRNEKAKGLWWRLLATLPVLALLMIANTKVTAQEKTTESQRITVEIGQFEIYDDDGAPMQLKDTIIYNEDGSYVKFVSSDAFDPISGEPRKKLSISTHNADGTTTGEITNLRWEMRGDTAIYTVEPFSISADKFRLDVIPGEDNPGQILRNDNDSVFQIVDVMPEFPGGMDAMMEFISTNIKYPEDAVNEGKEGRVFISFVVEKDGLVSNIKVLRGVCESIDEEATRVVRAMPRWKPGIKDGKAVRVSFQLPITFKLGQMDNENKTTVKTVVAEDESGKHASKTSTATFPDNPEKADMNPDNNGVYQTVDEMPQYPGGDEAMMEYVAKNVVYPQEARDKEISGRVFVGFIVEKDGSVSNVKAVRGIGGGCDEEAVRVVSAMPKWKPGKQDGQPVRVSYTLPIFFKLQ